ncbi:MAG TPA: iron-containing alcohol dehydrogenase [Streptosporangiaceae bacterium]
MSPAGPVLLDLAAVRAELAAAAEGGGALEPLGMGQVIDGDGALAGLPGAVSALASDGPVTVLAAATPITVAGRDLRAEVSMLLGGPGWVTVGPPDGHLHADEATVAAARAAVAGSGCVVSVGSGTLTDIGKAAAPAGAPLVAVQTATSVNGYSDPFSVLLRTGVKRTTPSRWPDVLVIDPAVLAGAPAELNRAGLGDLVSMFTCTADWYLAGAVGLDPTYSPAVAGLNRRYGERLLELAAGDLLSPASLAELARILTLSGIAMGVAGSTAPSSGMEHMISHLLEMAAGARGQASSYHGTQVGVATLVAAATWAHVRRAIDGGALGRPARIPSPDRAKDMITAAFKDLDETGAMAAECFADYSKKLRALAAGDPLARLRDEWERHDTALGAVLGEPAVLAAALRAAGLPDRFAALPEPVDDKQTRWAVASAPLQRARFSVADLAMLLGCWEDDDVDEVLATAGVLDGPR